MNLELCIHLYMIRKKYGIYVQEKRTIKNSYHCKIIDCKHKFTFLIDDSTVTDSQQIANEFNTFLFL